MPQNKFIFIAFLLTCFFIFSNNAHAANADIVINEIGAYESSDYEWLEIYNRGSQSIDLAGWKFFENSTNHGLNFAQGGSILSAGQYAVIAQNDTKFKEKYPVYSGILIDSSWSSLNESGEEIGLKDADGNFAELFTYIEAKNFSLERKDLNLNDYTAANWQEHQNGNTVGALNFASQNSAQNTISQSPETTQNANSSTENTISNSPTSNPSAVGQAPNILADAGENIIALIGQEIILDASKSQGASIYEWNLGDGSTAKEKIAKHKYNFPGKYIITLTISNGESDSRDQITASIYPSGVYISEFLPSPAGSDDNEWIEIYNSNDFPVDMSEWKLDDEPSSAKATAGKENKIKPFIIPQNTFIAAKNYLVFPRNATKIALNNDKDSVRFYYPENIVIDEIKYEKAKEGYSAARRQDGGFVWTKNITPGAPNIFLSEPTTYQNNTEKSRAVSVDSNSEKSINLITGASKYTVVSGGDFLIKNFISTANAQTVAQEEPAQNGENSGNQKSALENKNNSGNISANISESIKDKKSKNMISRIILTLFTLAIFAMMWQVMKRK